MCGQSHHPICNYYSYYFKISPILIANVKPHVLSEHSTSVIVHIQNMMVISNALICNLRNRKIFTGIMIFFYSLHSQKCSSCEFILIYRIRVVVFNATFNNISVISWWSVLLVDETKLPGENHQPATSH